VLDGKRECDIQQHLTTAGANKPKHIGKGAQRMITCYETNIPSQTDDAWNNDGEEPLWILMENGGDKTLQDRIRSETWNAMHAKLLFKQLMEGLNFLGSLEPPYTHHDLKPDNIVIREGTHGPLFNIFDFGCAAQL